jgi:hypothetical protein
MFECLCINWKWGHGAYQRIQESRESRESGHLMLI